MPDQFEQELRQHLEREASGVQGFPRELRDRIRERIDTRPRFTFPQQLALAAAMVLLVGLLAYGISQVRNLNNPQPAGSPRPTIAPTLTPAPTAAATPTPAASPTQTPTIYTCQNSSGGSTVIANLTRADAGNHEDLGYDRVVFQFDSPTMPPYTITRQSNATFTKSPSDQQVTLAGSAGVVVNFHDSVNGHDKYSGSRDEKWNFAVVKEMAIIEDFEGHVQWAIGLSKPACMNVQRLTNPTRLVIDFQAP